MTAFLLAVLLVLALGYGIFRSLLKEDIAKARKARHVYVKVDDQ